MDESSFKLHRAFALLVACLFGGIIGAVIGFEHRSYIQREWDRQRLNVRPVIANPPQFAIPCDKPGREEYSRICKARYRSGKVGG
jgi:hypothetical protein